MHINPPIGETVMRAIVLFFSAMILLFYVSMLPANTVNVPSDAATIQEGINEAVDGDTVLVADGIYTGDGNRDIDFLGKAIVVMSENGPDSCIIDCQGDKWNTHRGFYLHSGEDSTSVVQGFTVTNGYGGDPGGGGILCDGASPVITGNVLESNTAYQSEGPGSGGAVYCQGADITIIGNNIRNNDAPYGQGGGIYCSEATVRITDNIFYGNVASNGGAVYSMSSEVLIESNTIENNNTWYELGNGAGIYSIGSSIEIHDNLIHGNDAHTGGGGIYSSTSTVAIYGNIITENQSHYAISGDGGAISLNNDVESTVIGNLVAKNWAEETYGSGIYCSGETSCLIENNTFFGNWSDVSAEAAHILNSDVEIVNTIFWDSYWGSEISVDGSSSVTVSYCDIQNGWPGTGNIDTEPLFVDTEGDNYELSPDSPCIDSGDPAAEVPQNGGDRVDMGAFEYQYPEFSCPSLTFENTPSTGQRGETVTWEFTVANPCTDYVAFDGWVAVSGPNNSIRDSILDVSIPPGSSITGNVYLHIPHSAPLGMYTVKGRVGIIHEEIWDGEVFDGEVTENTDTVADKFIEDSWEIRLEVQRSIPITGR